MDFDFEQAYYRPIDIRNGYSSSDNNLIDKAEGYVESKYVNIEFSTLASVGSWLWLCDEVKVLKIPPDAELANNTPMSQGGCYEYSANKVIVQETISVIEFLERANNELIYLIHLNGVQFSKGYTFKNNTNYVILDKCTFQGNLLENHKCKTIKLWDCNIQGELLLPEKLEELQINNEGLNKFELSIQFPKIITGGLDLIFLEIKNEFDLSAYTCNHISFDFCNFSAPFILPKRQTYNDCDNKGNQIIVDKGRIVFRNCFGLENILIPENFTGERSLNFDNSPISLKLADSLKRAKDCIFKDISFENITLLGDFFTGINVKEICIGRCKIEGDLIFPEKLEKLRIFDKNLHTGKEKVQFPSVVEVLLYLSSLDIKEELDLSKYKCVEIEFRSCNFSKPIILPEKQIPTSESWNNVSTIEFYDCTGLENIVVPNEFEEGKTLKFYKSDIQTKRVKELKHKYGCKVYIDLEEV